MLHANVKAHPFNSKKPNPVYEKLFKSERSWFYLRIKLQSLIDTRFIVLSRSMLYYQKHLQHYLTILKKVRKKNPWFHPCIQICTTSYWGLFWANIHPSTNQLCSSCVILLKDQPTTKWTREKNLTSAEEISIFPMVSEIFHRIQHYGGKPLLRTRNKAVWGRHRKHGEVKSFLFRRSAMRPYFRKYV